MMAASDGRSGFAGCAPPPTRSGAVVVASPGGAVLWTCSALGICWGLCLGLGRTRGDCTLPARLLVITCNLAARQYVQYKMHMALTHDRVFQMRATEQFFRQIDDWRRK